MPTKELPLIFFWNRPCSTVVGPLAISLLWLSAACMGTQFAGNRGLSYDVGTGCTNCPISELHLKYTVYVDSRVGSTGGVSIVLYYSKILTACSYYNLKVSTS